MNGPRAPTELLDDILTESAYATEFVQGYTLETFQADPRTARAVAHALQTVGEAVYQLPSEVTDRVPDVPWHQIVRMRHLLVHHYWKTNLAILWSTVQKDLPSLVAAAIKLRDDVLAGVSPPPPPEAP